MRVRLAASTGPAGDTFLRRASRERRIWVGWSGICMGCAPGRRTALISRQMYQNGAEKREVRRKKMRPGRPLSYNTIVAGNFRTRQGAKNSLFLNAARLVVSRVAPSPTLPFFG